ncbi:MAG: VanZ family protein [Bacilli bacterium]|nr:VanZ family protein [Bacilli bacterium]
MKKIISYILLFIWLFIIFYFSNQTGNISGSSSGTIIYNILNYIYNVFHLNTTNLINIVETLHNPIRELMHLFEYLILGILIINVLKQHNIENKLIIISFCLCFIYATTDEIHQLFVKNRTFEYFDILMDMIGSIIGILIYRKIKVKL